MKLRAKPLKNLELVQPDFFAKGFEYTSKGLPPATKEEAEVVEKYGGVQRSYDLLTTDRGYRINGVPVNSMIEEMLDAARNP